MQSSAGRLGRSSIQRSNTSRPSSQKSLRQLKRSHTDAGHSASDEMANIISKYGGADAATDLASDLFSDPSIDS